MKEAIKRVVIIGIGIVSQFIIYLLFYMFLIDKLWLVNIIFSLFQIILIVYLIKYSVNYSVTLPIIIVILIFPIVGTLMCFIIAKNKKHSKVLKNIKRLENESKKYLVNTYKVSSNVNSNSLNYISNAGFPISNNSDVTYYSLGEIAFDAIIEELKKAKSFIFIEYFIISKGIMWNRILDILKDKVKEGVEIRVMYDDAGCLATLDKSYNRELENLGIKCVVFNKLGPVSGVIMNNRDHRKILIIDGLVAFSGGINLSDEYININSPHGHWKDNSVKVIGGAVWSYTVMFLTLWNAFKNEDIDFKKYKHNFKYKENNDSIVVPYCDTPLDNERTGEDIYLNIINQAKNYIYIFTPYLIIDTDMINSLILASKRGVDVRIVIPGVPDKKIVYTLTESYLDILIKDGVKIYKYTPGFIHSKVFVADDNIATVGTINLDYRSLYLHFECGLYLEKAKVIQDIKQDLINTINKSHLVLESEVRPKFLKAIWQAILRLFAPLM